MDVRWKNYKWDHVLRLVRQYKPVAVVVPDFIAKKQLDLLTRQINDLAALNVRRIMVCPKFDGALDLIPDGVIIAISVPTKYAGYLPAPASVSGRRLHLLGGTPDQQLYLMRHKYPGAHVISGDMNKHASKAAHGQYWHSTQARWIQTPKRQYPTAFLELVSSLSIRRYLENPRSAIRMNSKPVRLCFDPLPMQLVLGGI